VLTPLQVLYGNAEVSALRPDTLDIVRALVSSAEDLCKWYVEVQELTEQRERCRGKTEQLLAEVRRFGRQTEFGLRATASESTSPEIRQLGEHAIAAVAGLVETWCTDQEQDLATQLGWLDDRVHELEETMVSALAQLLTSLKNASSERRFRSALEEEGYRNAASIEVVPGVKLGLELHSEISEVPRRLRSLVGMTTRVQLGVRRNRKTKANEPFVLVLDDFFLIDSELSPHGASLRLSAHVDGRDPLGLQLAVVGDELPTGRVLRGNKERLVLPASDRPALGRLWHAMQQEADRMMGGPMSFGGFQLDDAPVSEPAHMVDILERVVQHYRPIVRKIAEFSPAPNELSLKVRTPDGRSSDLSLKREELAGKYAAMPEDLRRKFAIAELMPFGDSNPTANGAWRHGGRLANGTASFSGLRPIQLDPSVFGEEDDAVETNALRSRKSPSRQR